MNYQEIRNQEKEKISKLGDECGLFYAFSTKQFEEGKKKNPVEEGEKYTSLGMGGFIPSRNFKKFCEGLDKITAETDRSLKENKEGEEEAILYELRNYECFYSYDLNDVFDAFEGVYTQKRIREVFNKYKATYTE